MLLSSLLWSMPVANWSNRMPTFYRYCCFQPPRATSKIIHQFQQFHQILRVFSGSTAGNNHYKTLDLSQNATPDDIKKSFYALSKQCHPDLNPGDQQAEEKFKAIAAAYDTLSNSSKKAQYDSDLTSWHSAYADGRRQSRSTWTDMDRPGSCSLILTDSAD
jgi:hypothetical protein